MGYGMGKLEIIEHDGRGGLKFEERPYVVMADRVGLHGDPFWQEELPRMVAWAFGR